jgi:hypothetical protein
MYIITLSVTRCKTCKKKRGHVVEKYNGLVPVYCKCDLWDKEKRLANPCAIFCDTYADGPRPIWKPISDYRNKNGEWRHVPYFSGSF